MNAPKEELTKRKQESARLAKVAQGMVENQGKVSRMLCEQVGELIDKTYPRLCDDALSTQTLEAKVTIDVRVGMEPGKEVAEMVAKVTPPVHEVRSRKGV